ncbi:hypothetical protein ACQEVX_35355 [Streptomyces syringium]|uniref:hypothetical protein n=1 Tax=Streptomyces syringium TaxID=76729 RepID=UPI003D900A90
MTHHPDMELRYEDLCRSVAGKLAPDELASFELISAPYRRNSVLAAHRLSRAARRGGELGSGLAYVSASLSPWIVLLCAWVMSAISSGVKEEVGRYVVRKLRALLNRFGIFPRRVAAQPAVRLGPEFFDSLRADLQERLDRMEQQPPDSALLIETVLQAAKEKLAEQNMLTDG